MFGEPELSTQLAIQEQINIISYYLISCTTFCTISSILLINSIVILYFSILLINNTITYIPYNNSSYMEYNNFSYYDDSFSL